MEVPFKKLQKRFRVSLIGYFSFGQKPKNYDRILWRKKLIYEYNWCIVKFSLWLRVMRALERMLITEDSIFKCEHRTFMSYSTLQLMKGLFKPQPNILILCSSSWSASLPLFFHFRYSIASTHLPFLVSAFFQFSKICTWAKDHSQTQSRQTFEWRVWANAFWFACSASWKRQTLLHSFSLPAWVSPSCCIGSRYVRIMRTLHQSKYLRRGLRYEKEIRIFYNVRMCRMPGS